ncbi:hypothetical protein MTR_1g033890 [Medicago truncatula]|uniref:Uncharacterized protein n=1 Tax=Medicago truncatula TaxID=3880 RepID=A0A072VFB8_MEDTR|nr:hypothetical protein MTR_1g033890 [Medicago truncatula]
MGTGLFRAGLKSPSGSIFKVQVLYLIEVNGPGRTARPVLTSLNLGIGVEKLCWIMEYLPWSFNNQATWFSRSL